MREEFRPAIDALLKDVADQERKLSETKGTVNRLCELAGAPPMYSDIGIGSQPTLGSIRADSFYGKVITTAAREYMEMRKAGGLGPASPRIIYEALKQGGFKFDTNIENNAITGIRNALRKYSQVFHRLPNGEYGLLSWYPNAKSPKGGAGGGEDADQEAPQAKRGRPKNTRMARPRRRAKAAATNGSGGKPARTVKQETSSPEGETGAVGAPVQH